MGVLVFRLHSRVLVSLFKSAAGFVILLVAAALLSPASWAQQTLGGMNGTVSDSSGAVIAGATVKARTIETNLVVNVHTKHDGSFAIADLPIGTYELTFTKEGFETAV